MSNRNGPSALRIQHPNSAGIDVGASSHFVAIPAHLDPESVREFSSVTADLKRLADWLVEHRISIVAMESTGVYWIPLFELLESRGMEVLLVNARHIKNVSGRKSDVLDCQWLQQLLSYGLLRGAYRPREAVCVLRAYTRQRSMLLRNQARCVQHMQKALVQMNIQLGNAISDVAGETGFRILRAIVKGVRDPLVLAAMKNARIRADEATIARSLEGNWRAEHLFALRQAIDTYDFNERQLGECDIAIDAQMAKLKIQDAVPEKARRRSASRNAPQFDARTRLAQMLGVDLTRIDGIDVSTALIIASEVGNDLSRFPSAKHFASWLGLCPGTHITGGSRISGKTKRCANRIAQALKLAAVALRRSQSALGAYHRRLCARMDKAKAVTASAHKLARLVYTMITKAEQYVDQGQAYFEQQHRDRAIRSLMHRAQQLGMTLIDLPTGTTTTA